MHWYFEVLKKYAIFDGRASRTEYWMFFLINLLIFFGLGFIAGLGHQSAPEFIYELVILIPSIAMGVRRMHDTDHSGWWLLVPIVGFIFAVSDGTRGNNRFGPDPKVALSQAH